MGMARRRVDAEERFQNRTKGSKEMADGLRDTNPLVGDVGAVDVEPEPWPWRPRPLENSISKSNWTRSSSCCI
jgi:hypothetical protein